MEPQSVVRVLTDIARTASETLELQEVFNRVAASIRELIPFEEMGVIRIHEGEWAVLHASTFSCGGSEACSEPVPLSSWSPRLRPRPGPIPRLDDAPNELDPAFPRDAETIQAGVRSGLWEPLLSGDTFIGGVWLSAARPHVFTDEHQEVLGPIAALLASAVEHWRIWDAERARRERLNRLEVMLETLAASLDIREMFGRISDAVQEVLPHDFFLLADLDETALTFTITASAGRADIEVPSGPIRFTPQELERRTLDYDIVRDIPAELEPTTDRNRLILASGMRSWLRLPVRRLGEINAAIAFMHREPARYGLEDVEVGRRIADRIALVLSHESLAAEERIATEARERAERLAATVETLARELESRDRRSAVGVSGAWREVMLQVGRVAPSDTTVLITGESGTGKEVVARLVHRGSARAERPFVAINCAALPEQLLESELFGHERGAFTGATAAKVGRIEQAAGGTLFLDEIAEMSPFVQAKFLRVLQEREFERLGGTRVLRADVRVIAATNRDLAAAIERGLFREDLFYRLNVFQIPILPLRQRPEDILPLAESFLVELGRTMGRPAAGISRDARDLLLAYPWPGNARELRNAIERAILLCDGGLITREHLPVAVGRPGAAGPPGAARPGESRAGVVPTLPSPTLPPAAAPSPAAALPSGPTPPPAATLHPQGFDLEAVERGYVEGALRQAGGNKSKAARLLGLTRAQLYTRLEKYGLR